METLRLRDIKEMYTESLRMVAVGIKKSEVIENIGRWLRPRTPQSEAMLETRLGNTGLLSWSSGGLKSLGKVNLPSPSLSGPMENFQWSGVFLSPSFPLLSSSQRQPCPFLTKAVKPPGQTWDCSPELSTLLTPHGLPPFLTPNPSV